MNLVIIRFPDEATEKQGLEYLIGRFSFTTWATGETLVPDAALSHLALEGIRFIVEGSPTYEQLVTAVRGTPAVAV